MSFKIMNFLFGAVILDYGKACEALKGVNYTGGLFAVFKAKQTQSNNSKALAKYANLNGKYYNMHY